MRFPDDFPQELQYVVTDKAHGMLRAARTLISEAMIGKIDRFGRDEGARYEMELQHRLRRDTAHEIARSLKIKRTLCDTGTELEITLVVAQEEEFFALLRSCYEAGIRRVTDSWTQHLKAGGLA